MTGRSFRRPTIMVVDDDPAVRSLLCDLFLDVGYEVVRAENGQRALSKLGLITPDLITLDLEMPGVDGAALLTVIRQRMAACPLAVVVISAHDRVPTPVRSQVQAVLGKPFDIAALLDAVERILAHPPRPLAA